MNPDHALGIGLADLAMKFPEDSAHRKVCLDAWERFEARHDNGLSYNASVHRRARQKWGGDVHPAIRVAALVAGKPLEDVLDRRHIGSRYEVSKIRWAVWYFMHTEQDITIEEASCLTNGTAGGHATVRRGIASFRKALETDDPYTCGLTARQLLDAIKAKV